MLLLSSQNLNNPTHPLIDKPSQMQELHARGIQVDATGFTEE